MERGILTQEYRHEPVMLGEVLESLQLKSGSVVCDCTLGGAGHSVKMAAQVGETGLLLGVDQDDMALEAAGARLDREVPGVPHQLLKGNFGDLDELLCSAEVPGVDGFLFDLGVSSPQLDIPGRGFSYNEDAPLDMRMDPGNNTLNAAEVIPSTINDTVIDDRSLNTCIRIIYFLRCCRDSCNGSCKHLSFCCCGYILNGDIRCRDYDIFYNCCFIQG